MYCKGIKNVLIASDLCFCSVSVRAQQRYIAKWPYNSFDEFAGFAKKEYVKLSKLGFNLGR